MLRFGIISEVDPEKGLARVEFAEDGIVSFWLPVSQPRTQGDKFFYTPGIGEQVWCLMDDRSENGVIGGSLYSSVDTPPEGMTAGRVGVEFSDGTIVDYDKTARRLRVKIEDAEFNITAAGHTVKRGGESLKSLLTELLAALENETHPTPSGPSGPPLNKAVYTDLKTRVNEVFEN